MFFPVVPNVWRWDTPDPQGSWMMVGHLVLGPDGAVALDPPMRPGLEEGIRALGGLRAVVLTTQDHTRGARHLQKTFRCPVYVPEQAELDPLKAAGLTDAIPYGEGNLPVSGLRAIRGRVVIPGSPWGAPPYIDEMLLARGDDVVVSGDMVLGGPDGGLQLCPEGFTDRADPAKVQAVWETLAVSVPATASTLLAGHGQDIVGRLKEQVMARRPGSIARQ